MNALNRIVGAFRWLFMPLSLFALIAVGVHAAADLVDDRLLRLIERADVFFDGLFAPHEWSAAWVHRIDSRERTLIARALALVWELACDFVIAVPMLGHDEPNTSAWETLKPVLARVNAKPTPMRIVRPLITVVFAGAGAYLISTLVESTAFVGLVGDVAPSDVAEVVARVLGGLAMVMVLFGQGRRAVVRALIHADAVSTRVTRPWLAGTWGTVVSLPLAFAALLQIETVGSFFR